MGPVMPQMQKKEEEKMGLLERLGKGIQNYRSDPEKMARLQMGFNTMRLNPDPNIAANAANTIKMAQQKRQSGVDANSTIAYLNTMPNNPLAQQALKAIQANPAMAKDIFSSFLSNQFKPRAMSKNIGSIQTAQTDMTVGDTQLKAGDQYTITYDPNANGGYSVTNLGTSGLTQAEEATLASKTEIDLADRLADRKIATDLSKDLFKQYDSLDKQAASLQEIRNLIANEGAITGPIRSRLPTFDAATQSLRTIANQLGIQIINSATFGALSATELRLALETGFPQNLGPKAAVEYIDKKLAAQAKLRSELLKKVNKLQRMPFSQYTSELEDELEQESMVAMPPKNDPELIRVVNEINKGRNANNIQGQITVQSFWDSLNTQERLDYMGSN